MAASSETTPTEPSRPRAVEASDPSERELFELVYRRMRALAGAAAPDLDDLVQLAAERVLRSLPTFAGRSELGTWVYGVCYHVLLNHRRWYRRWVARFSSEEAPVEVASAAPLPFDELERRERVARLRRVLLRMSDKYRAVVVMHDLEELGIEEIARIVRANPLTVRSRLRDGREQLRRLMAEDATLTDEVPR